MCVTTRAGDSSLRSSWWLSWTAQTQKVTGVPTHVIETATVSCLFKHFFFYFSNSFTTSLLIISYSSSFFFFFLILRSSIVCYWSVYIYMICWKGFFFFLMALLFVWLLILHNKRNTAAWGANSSQWGRNSP